MTPHEIDGWLARTLDDRNLSRGERQALREFVASLGPQADRHLIRHRAFEAARAALGNPNDAAVLDWLAEVVKAVSEDGPGAGPRWFSEAHFSPGEDCPRAIRRLLTNARHSADVCVFTITDDRLADALVESHSRGVSVRIITDDAKADDLGSDVDRFGQAGIALRLDRSPYHMHHKFAIVDGTTLLTGSYNWTRGAARDNQENLVVTDDPRLVSPFATAFNRLWDGLA